MFTCPMHPEVVSEKPGMCPECGMALVRTHDKRPTTNDAPPTHVPVVGRGSPVVRHSGHSTAMFLRKFWVSLALTVPVLLYSELPARFFDFTAPAFPGSAYLPLLFGSIVFFYGGWVFLIGAFRELRGRAPGMMTLIALAISTAYAWSVIEVLRGGAHTLFWELASLITIMLLGHWLEMRAVKSAQGALRELSKLLPDTAEVVQSANRESQIATKMIPLTELKEGDLVLVRPGGKVPADGKVEEGSSEVNESLLTGESKPVKKTVGSEVVAGTTNGDGMLKVRITKIGEHTFLAGVMRLVADAQASKSKLQLLSDRAAYYLTVIAVATGLITFTAWLTVLAGFETAIERLVAVLVVACPHALGLAIPLVATISTTLAARHGFLVRNRMALELARNVDVVLFDKTGTLTEGSYGIERTFAFGVVGESELLGRAAAVDAHSEHFIARAIVKGARDRRVPIAGVKDFARLPGKGVRGVVDGKETIVGGAPVLAYAKNQISEAAAADIAAEETKGRTVIYVIQDGAALGAISLGDVIREESREAVRTLTSMGVRVAMLTGDTEGVAAWVGRELGIDEVFARVLPGDKAAKVKLLQSGGARVAMVGDGVNDAPALTQADVGIAIGAGTNVAIESAGIILVRNDPRDVASLITLSRRTYRKMLQNLFWAAGYNVAAIPLAAGALASYGFVLEPALAAVLMSLSTVIVAGNAMLLKRLKLS